MSDFQTVWKLGLAFGCSVGALWMKFGSGVSDDSKASDVRNDVGGDMGRARRDHRGSKGDPMKGTDEHRG